MKLTLLSENNTLYCTYLQAEHGFSAYIEDDGKKILYDTGATDLFIRNAELLDIDLTAIDCLVLSHGHYDHSAGVKHLVEYYKKKRVTRKPVLMFTSTELFLRKYDFERKEEQGMDMDLETLKAFFDVRITTETTNLTPNLFYLGKVDRANSFECATPQKAKKLKDGEWVEDFVTEDTQLAYRHKDGRVSVVTGCSHNGVCNNIAYAKKVTGADKVHNVIGGLHLQSPSKELLEATKNFVRQAEIDTFYACHCCDFPSRMALATISNVQEAGVSLVLDWT